MYVVLIAVTYCIPSKGVLYSVAIACRSGGCTRNIKSAFPFAIVAYHPSRKVTTDRDGKLERWWVTTRASTIDSRSDSSEAPTHHAFKPNPTLRIFPHAIHSASFSFDQTAFHIAPTSVFARWVRFSKASFRVQFDRRDEKDDSLAANDGHLTDDHRVTRSNNPSLRERLGSDDIKLSTGC